MKEPMTDARRKQLYRIKKRKRRKQCIRVALRTLRMAVLCFLVLFAVQKTADLLRVDDSDRMEDAEQSYSGQGGKTRTNTDKYGKNMGSIRKSRCADTGRQAA